MALPTGSDEAPKPQLRIALRYLAVVRLSLCNPSLETEGTRDPQCVAYLALQATPTNRATRGRSYRDTPRMVSNHAVPLNTEVQS